MKRFTATEKWSDSWFMKLTPAQKLAWLYVVDQCDCSGVWDRNDPLANCQIGSQIDWDDALKAFGEGRVRVLPNGKWFLPGFVGFQYGSLSPDARVHQAVITRLKDHGLWDSYGIAMGLESHQEKEKVQDKDKDSRGECEGNRSNAVSRRIRYDLEREQGGNAAASKRPTLESLLLHGAKIGLPESEVHRFFNYYESKGWVVGKVPMRSPTHAMANWKSRWEEQRQSSRRKVQPI